MVGAAGGFLTGFAGGLDARRARIQREISVMPEAGADSRRRRLPGEGVLDQHFRGLDRTPSPARPPQDADNGTSRPHWQWDGPFAPVEMINTSGAIRSMPIRETLSQSIARAVSEVYGDGHRVRVYSGGQEARGAGRRRTGSVRHDADENGLGRAADVYIYGPDGRITGDRLAPLAQYWAAHRLGGVGLEMRGGGLHLDDWTSPPPGGAMHWYYGQPTPAQQAAMSAGLRGQIPTLARAVQAEVSAPARPQAPEQNQNTFRWFRNYQRRTQGAS
jgi:hypothetical protein